MRQVAFMVDPGAIVLSIGATNYNETGDTLIATMPGTFFKMQDDNGVWDLCMNIDDAADNPSGEFIVGEVTIPLTALDFFNGRPPVRPPAKNA